ncbi:MAG: SIMPL domain-containing protein [Candidatus Magasanikbacteria bacterium]|nr:SIMPL domain-containing protein [Candidatus Magasanikbacteria bacterium]
MKSVAVIFGSLILGLTLASGLWLHAWENGRNSGANVLSVTGSVKKNVTADLAKWTASFNRRATVENVKETLDQAAKDARDVKNFIAKYGIPESAITFLPLQTETLYEPNYGYSTKNVIGYLVRQEVRVEHADIAKVEQLAQDVKKLIDQGIIPESQRTEYFYTKISDLRPELFSAATKDARERARAIAAGSGARIGRLRSARTGVMQILAPNSTNFEDYGAYDTSTKEKEILATVTVSFTLQ